MAKFIELRRDLFINIEKIEAIELIKSFKEE